MARYKPYDLNQLKMIPLCYADRIVKGSFEHLDLPVFISATQTMRRRPAYDPRILLKFAL